MNERRISRLFPNASKAFIKANSSPEDNPERVCSPKQEQLKRDALERFAQREAASRSCYVIRFKIKSVRPCDWDNYWTKCIQDVVVQTGIIHDDAWFVLQGSVKSEKAHSKNEEETEITIEQIC